MTDITDRDREMFAQGLACAARELLHTYRFIGAQDLYPALLDVARSVQRGERDGMLVDQNRLDRQEVVHRIPQSGSSTTPCCGKTLFELPRTDRATFEATEVTCVG